MKSKNLLCVFLILFTSFSIWSRGKQELIPSGHWIYDSVENICVELGIVNFADCQPMSIAELKVYLEEIDTSKLSDASLSEINEIYKYFEYEPLGFSSDIVNIGLEPSVNLSSFYKTNDDIDWIYNRYKRKPFINTPVSITASDYITLKMDLLLGMNKNSALKNDVYTNIPIREDYIDINFPDTGYFSTGYNFTQKTGISFQLGKGSRNIGKTLTGSIIWSDNVTGVSYGQFTLFSPEIKYTGVVSQFNVDRYMYTHQVDARFFKKFQFSVLEGVFVNAPMELRFLNPFTIFHGMAPWREYDNKSRDSESHTCAYLGLKFQYTPFEKLKLYGLFAMTQFQTPYETSNYESDTTPNGLGGQLGSLYIIPLKSSRIKFSIEASYAQPYLYIKESPNWSLVRTYAENMGSKRYPFYEWIGSPFGPDTVSAEFKTTYEVLEKYSIDFIYLFMARGEMSENNVFTSMKDSDGNYAWGGLYTGNDYPDDWCYPDKTRMGSLSEAKRRQSLVTPTGIPEFVNRFSLCSTYKFTKKIEGTFMPSVVFIFNNNHQTDNFDCGLELAAACSISF